MTKNVKYPLNFWKWNLPVHYSVTEPSSTCHFKVLCQTAAPLSQHPKARPALPGILPAPAQPFHSFMNDQLSINIFLVHAKLEAWSCKYYEYVAILRALISSYAVISQANSHRLPRRTDQPTTD